jgi:hypothetical protein
MLVFAVFAVGTIGCEVDGRADDDGAKLEVDVDD